MASQQICTRNGIAEGSLDVIGQLLLTMPNLSPKPQDSEYLGSFAFEIGIILFVYGESTKDVGDARQK